MFDVSNSFKTIVLILVSGFAVAVDHAATAQSNERTFECPRVSPLDGRTPLAYIQVLQDGEANWGGPDAGETWRTGRVVRWRDDHSMSGFVNGRMNCLYGWNRRPPLHTVTIEMPGHLLRCEGEYIDPPPSRVRLDARQWCTTRPEGSSK